MGSGRGGRWVDEEKSYVCTGSLCREPRAGLEAASVFSVSWLFTADFDNSGTVLSCLCF